ncbi:GIY-YIG nuclease family protein [Stenotrophomonas sp. ESTM1D_MKCIP4_1]|uniref:GIY-YIG nuclease family protein n=1 Tax=Stenotrophomonas sp. ESTM1D_MKCIP4_1 TaxID=2072414 RepID=UPI00131F3E35|nr:GIY-YIG nuclease family protein [Stenotrophomonas sp. ESTM1D_MKCIP4_1]
MKPATLSESNITAMGISGDGQGVYQLFYKGELAYIGKTDLEAGLRKRLLRHANKISSRKNIEKKDVKFLSLRVYVYSAMDLESSLIAYYKKQKTPAFWNTSGFGSNDPGRQRDTSGVKESHFDSLYPIDLDWSVGEALIESKTIADALIILKKNTPYLIRFETNRKKAPHADLANCAAPQFNKNESVGSALLKISRSLGAKWQITALPGYVIVYREKREYAHGTVIKYTSKKRPAS